MLIWMFNGLLLVTTCFVTSLQLMGKSWNLSILLSHCNLFSLHGARPWTLTGKIWVGSPSFPSLSYINFGKIVLRSGKLQILFWRLLIWRGGTQRWNLHEPDPKMSCTNLKKRHQDNSPSNVLHFNMSYFHGPWFLIQSCPLFPIHLNTHSITEPVSCWIDGWQ